MKIEKPLQHVTELKSQTRRFIRDTAFQMIREYTNKHAYILSPHLFFPLNPIVPR